MRARLKADYIYPAMRACGGTMFNKTDWTEVPAGQEQSAIVNADIEVEGDAPPATELIISKPAKKARIK